ncbi:hypothetical protein BJ165DRAFT_1526713 [Panaeolus papilionaceus]|nr:hypothetical protein BJ165DRAFT_1526713 [Panaeolus papilionaceus]
MGALRPRNGSTHVVVTGAPPKKPIVACITSKVCAKRSTRVKKLETPKPTPRRRSLSPKATTPTGSSPNGPTPNSPAIPSANSSRRRSVILSRMLPRPAFREPSDAALCAVGFESMIKENRNIVRMMVDSIIPQFEYFSALYNFDCDTTKGQARSVVLDYSKNDALPTVPPTHMMAITGNRRTPPSSPPHIKLYPVHSSILAVHCASLAIFPQPLPIEKPLTDKRQIRLPICYLPLPSPEMFPHLLVFLYTKDVSVLFKACLPAAPPMDDEATMLSFSRHLAQTYTRSTLVEHIQSVVGLWANACSLGVFDMRLWSAIDLMWSTLLNALEIVQKESSRREGAESTPVPVSPPA